MENGLIQHRTAQAKPSDPVEVRRPQQEPSRFQSVARWVRARVALPKHKSYDDWLDDQW
jgi:hypothetical protein